MILSITVCYQQLILPASLILNDKAGTSMIYTLSFANKMLGLQRFNPTTNQFSVTPVIYCYWPLFINKIIFLILF